MTVPAAGSSPHFCTREDLRVHPDDLPLEAQLGARQSVWAEPTREGRRWARETHAAGCPGPSIPSHLPTPGTSPKARIPGGQARNLRGAFLILLETLLPFIFSFSSSRRVYDPVLPTLSTSSFLDACFRFFLLTPAGQFILCRRHGNLTGRSVQQRFSQLCFTE